MTTIKLKEKQPLELPEGFIPVSERLPEVEKTVLVLNPSITNTGGYKARYCVDGKWRDKHGVLDPKCYPVIAWKNT